MKYLANIISASRIILSIAMICFYKNELLFVILYIACGFSDALDGYIARKTNTQSAMGAKLDSIADFLMFGIIVTFMILWAGDKLTPFFPWLIVIALIRCGNIIIAAYKYHSFAILHTWGNKITGLLIFLAPIAFIAFASILFLWFVCLIALLSAIEEGIIHLTSNELNLNRRSIFKE